MPRPLLVSISLDDDENKNGFVYNVATWWKIIGNECRSPQELNNLTVTKVGWFKVKDGLEHEFLVITVNVREPISVAYLRIERSTNREAVDKILKEKKPLEAFLKGDIELIPLAERPTAEEGFRKRLKQEDHIIATREARSSPSRSGSSSMSGSLKKNDPSIAIDSVSQADTDTGFGPACKDQEVECLVSFTFDKPTAPRFPLRDLGIMAREIHNLNTSYSLRQHNCYWFARTLMDLILEMKEPTTGSMARVEARAGNVALKGSTVISASVIKPNSGEIGDLVRKIKSAIEADDQRIAEEWEAGAGGKAKLDEMLLQERQENAEREARLLQEKAEKDSRIAELEAQLRQEQSQNRAATSKSTMQLSSSRAY